MEYAVLCFAQAGNLVYLFKVFAFDVVSRMGAGSPAVLSTALPSLCQLLEVPEGDSPFLPTEPEIFIVQPYGLK